MVIEMYVSVYHVSGFSKGSKLVSVDALRFQNPKEIFSHGIVRFYWTGSVSQIRHMGVFYMGSELQTMNGQNKLAL